MLAVATVAAGLLYLWWLVGALNPFHPAMSAAFMTAEIICLSLFVSATFTVWRLRYKPPEGLPVSSTPCGVDVFVPVCGEPIAVVETTLRGVAAIEWAGTLTVYVLDDGGSREVEELAARHGFVYLSRARNGERRRHAKAGNLNFGLSQSDGELVLVLDADQVPEPNILLALAGYMRFPRVAFVQSRQSFYVPLGDPFFSLDRVFYEAVQLGYDHYDNAISCGSGVLYRRTALANNEGFATWNVVEDLTTSYDLHSRGWQSFYYSHALSRGLAPADIWGVYRQRGQWALDTMRLFLWDNPLLKRGLSFNGRISYLVIPLSYLSAAIVFPFFFALPIWTYLTGGSVLSGSELEFAFSRGLYFVVMALALRSLFRKHETGRQFQTLTGLFPVYLSGMLRAFVYPRGRSPLYRPNNVTRATKRLPPIVAVIPQITLLAANALLPFYAIVQETAPPRLILSSAIISAVAIWSLVPTIVAALATPKWEPDMNPNGVYRQPAETRS